MGRVMRSDSWFGNLLQSSRKSGPETEKAKVGVLAFEVVSLMSKITSLWHYLSDNEIHRLRKEILDSAGVQKLVSDDDNYLMDLALNEIVENFALVARSVGRLGRKCTDPLFRGFETFVNDPFQHHLEWTGWEYRLKKMERKMKKMDRFVASTMQLSQELEVLSEFEQTLRRMKANPDLDRGKLFEFKQKVMWQREEVKNLREMSPWIRTHDYIVRLLARSLLTILERIKYVFEINQLPRADRRNDHKLQNPGCLSRTHSFSAFMQSSIHPSENFICGISTGPHGRADSRSGPRAKNNNTKKHQGLHHQSYSLLGKQPKLKTERLPSGTLKGCMTGSESPIVQSCKPIIGGSERYAADYLKNIDKMKNLMGYLSSSQRVYSKLAIFSSKGGLLKARSSTLGNAALAVHYASVIVLIERLVSFPHMIDSETRDDLYSMLTVPIRAALRARLRATTSQSPSVYESSVADEWCWSLKRILEWLAPLAHNMIKWQSERNFEREQEVSRMNVLLVQTLHYADQAKTEAAITDLLVGLNYICRANKLNKGGLPELSSRSTNHECKPKCYARRAYSFGIDGTRLS